MPQMAPMLWLILFAYFIILFLMFISNFYFSYTPVVVCEAKTSSSAKETSLNWLW